jgi:hypothetical protein
VWRRHQTLPRSGQRGRIDGCPISTPCSLDNHRRYGKTRVPGACREKPLACLQHLRIRTRKSQANSLSSKASLASDELLIKENLPFNIGTYAASGEATDCACHVNWRIERQIAGSDPLAHVMVRVHNRRLSFTPYMLFRHVIKNESRLCMQGQGIGATYSASSKIQKGMYVAFGTTSRCRYEQHVPPYTHYSTTRLVHAHQGP